MAGEEWARKIVEATINQKTFLHDDGSAPSMYDLRVGPAENPIFAIECTRAVSPQFMATWNTGPGRGPLHLSLRGNWTVEFGWGARMKNIGVRLEPVLLHLERLSFFNILVDFRLEACDPGLFTSLKSLGITHAICHEQAGAGKVHLSLTGAGGMVDERGTAIPDWISDFLRDPKRDDVVRKLDLSGASETHAFVIVGFGGAPWEVEGYLTSRIQQLPTVAPTLPSNISGVWLIAEGAANGLRWDGTAWKKFDTLQSS